MEVKFILFFVILNKGNLVEPVSILSPLLSARFGHTSTYVGVVDALVVIAGMGVKYPFDDVVLYNHTSSLLLLFLK